MNAICTTYTRTLKAVQAWAGGQLLVIVAGGRVYKRAATGRGKLTSGTMTFPQATAKAST